MSVLEAIVLGIIQGLTEFLPVSSSGHIELGKYLFGLSGDEDLTFSIVVHAATVLSTLVVFRKDIIEILQDLLKFEWNDSARFCLNIIVSMIPVLIVGLFFKDQVESLFTGNILLVGGMLIITGILLYLTGTRPFREKNIEPKNAFIIGIAQALASLPGISRSGATIATGLLLGVDRKKIARFSFLMVVVPILGITFLDLRELISSDASFGISVLPLVGGFISAFFVGLMACSWMIDIVKKGKITYFAYYCFLVGGLAIVSSFFLS